VPLTLLGAALLWFGWFGFNAGSELAADGIAAIAFINTLAAPAAAMLGWILIEYFKHGKATSIGAASGAVAGLVAITPACASVDPMYAILLGLIAGALCALAVDLKFAAGFDDSLDVVGIHLVGGIVGTLFIGFFGNGVGAAFGHGWHQLAMQALGAGAVLVYSFVLALLIGFLVEKTIGFRVKAEDEIAGIDTVVHGEEAYAFGADRG
jgi:Amt family ammonium transporter